MPYFWATALILKMNCLTLLYNHQLPLWETHLQLTLFKKYLEGTKHVP